jgi:hypothetical protein
VARARKERGCVRRANCFFDQRLDGKNRANLGAVSRISPE